MGCAGARRRISYMKKLQTFSVNRFNINYPKWFYILETDHSGAGYQSKKIISLVGILPPKFPNKREILVLVFCFILTSVFVDLAVNRRSDQISIPTLDQVSECQHIAHNPGDSLSIAYNYHRYEVYYEIRILVSRNRNFIKWSVR